MAETSSAPETGPSPAADLPDGEPIPAPAVPSDSKSATAPRHPPTPSSSKGKGKKTGGLPALLRAVPAGTDAFLSHLQRCLATSSGVDTLLLFVCYLSRFTGAALTSLSQALLRRTARDVIALALRLPPKTAVIFGTTTGAAAAAATAGAAGAGGEVLAAPAAARIAALLGQRLKSLGSLASETRTMARLWGLVGTYFWAKRLVLRALVARRGTEDEESEKKNGGAATAADRFAALLDWVQFVSCAVFQVLENGAYLSGRGVLGWTPAQQGRAYIVGSRALGVYTALELGRLAGRLAAKTRGRRGGSGSDSGDAGAVGDQDQDAAEVEAMRRSLAINMAWAPLTLNWSLEKGFLSDLAVGAGGCIPGVLQMRKLWRETA